MSESRGIRDPIHGFIQLESEECKIIDSPVFQRLRRIRQLSFAYLVYPGALHTRFDHTLGVFHVASKMAKTCNLSDDEQRLVRLAALLHDLGHGPFSHVSEGALDLFADRAKLGDAVSVQKADKIHEMLTCDILDKDQSLARILGTDTLSDIKKLLLRGYGDPILKSIVSGPLDADKQDYLLRDTYFCGVKYGVFDIERLHRMFHVVQDQLDEKQLMIKQDGVHTLEQFILAKYYLTAQVYRHRVRRITDEMVVRAIVLGIEKDSIDSLKQLYAYDGSQSFFENYMQWDDARFLLEFGSNRYEGSCCKEIISRLSSRHLLKQVFDAPFSDIPENCREILSQISLPQFRNWRSQLEKSICSGLQEAGISMQTECCDPSNLLIVHNFSLKSVRAQSRNDEASIMVDQKPEPLPFEEASDLFRSINEKMAIAHFAVYAPVTFDNPVERKRVQDAAHKAIMLVLEGLTNGD